MPYADPETQKGAKREWFNGRYDSDRAFREAEKARKARWYQENRERLIQKVIEARSEKRKVTT